MQYTFKEYTLWGVTDSKLPTSVSRIYWYFYMLSVHMLRTYVQLPPHPHLIVILSKKLRYNELPLSFELCATTIIECSFGLSAIMGSCYVSRAPCLVLHFASVLMYTTRALLFRDSVSLSLPQPSYCTNIFMMELCIIIFLWFIFTFSFHFCIILENI